MSFSLHGKPCGWALLREIKVSQWTYSHPDGNTAGAGGRQSRGEQQRRGAAASLPPSLPPSHTALSLPPAMLPGLRCPRLRTRRSGPRGGFAVCVPSAEAMAAVAGGGTGPGSGSGSGGARAATTNILAQLRHGQLSGRGLTRGAQVTRCGPPVGPGPGGRSGEGRGAWGTRGVWGRGCSAS